MFNKVLVFPLIGLTATTVCSVFNTKRALSKYDENKTKVQNAIAMAPCYATTVVCFTFTGICMSKIINGYETKMDFLTEQIGSAISVTESYRQYFEDTNHDTQNNKYRQNLEPTYVIKDPKDDRVFVRKLSQIDEARLNINKYLKLYGVVTYNDLYAFLDLGTLINGHLEGWSYSFGDDWIDIDIVYNKEKFYYELVFGTPSHVLSDEDYYNASGCPTE